MKKLTLIVGLLGLIFGSYGTASDVPVGAAFDDEDRQDCNVHETPCYCWVLCLDEVGDFAYCEALYGQYCPREGAIGFRETSKVRNGASFTSAGKTESQLEPERSSGRRCTGG